MDIREYHYSTLSACIKAYLIKYNGYVLSKIERSDSLTCPTWDWRTKSLQIEFDSTNTEAIKLMEPEQYMPICFVYVRMYMLTGTNVCGIY